MSREVDRRPRRWQHARVSHEAFLEIKTVSGKRYSFPLEAESTLVGHDAKDVALYIEDPLLSKQHFAIERRGAEWVLIDAGSRNGTFVDGVKLKERAEAKLKDGAAITCGLTTLVFRLGAINEQAPPVRILQPSSLSTHQRHQGQGFVMLHLGAGMPDRGERAGEQIVVWTHGDDVGE